MPGRILETPSLTLKGCDALIIIIDIHSSVVIIILNIFCLAVTFVFGVFPIVGPSVSLPCCFLRLQPTVSYKNTEVSQIRNLAKNMVNMALANKTSWISEVSRSYEFKLGVQEVGYLR